MKVLHVFPMFTRDGHSGSHVYNRTLSQELAKQMEVDVFTTRTKQIKQLFPFLIRWEEQSQAYEKIGKLNVYRFPTWNMPTMVGALGSSLILRRWKREGIPQTEMVEKYIAHAKRRGVFYEYLSRIGRGPNCSALIKEVCDKQKEYDLILAGMMPFNTMTLPLKRMQKPIVLLPLFHPNDYYHHWKYFYKSFKEADCVSTLTTYTRDLLRVGLDVKAETIGGGIFLDEFLQKGISGERFRKQYGLEGKKIILFVGRKEPGKNYAILLDVLENIGESKNVCLVMIGEDVDKLPIRSKHVVYLGKVQKQILLDAYDACNVFCFPSRYESFGLTLLEAWARRKPVIGNAACGPVTSIIQDGRDGFLFSSHEDLQKKILFLLENDEAARRMGKKGFEKVIKYYTWEKVVERVLKVYNHLV